MSEPFLDAIFQRLRTNIDFPYYQAERRIDIFINHFLERILIEYLKVKKAEFVCPEFPLKKKDGNLSTKLDYLCRTDKEIIFVELKTTAASLKDDQAKTYLNSKWTDCIKGINTLLGVKRNKDEQDKFKVLEAALINHKIYDKEKGIDFPIKVIYVSPLPNKRNSKIYKIVNDIRFNKLNLNINDDENASWNYLNELNMSVFEIVKK